MKKDPIHQEAMSSGQFKKIILFALLLLLIRPSYTNAEYSLINNATIQDASGVICTKSSPAVLTPLKGYCSNGTSYLFWGSLQESNSSHFEIQRSTDGIIFYSIGTVAAKSSSDREVEYAYKDPAANDGINYYRLKLLDKDENSKYSNILMLTLRIKGINVTAIYPAPFSDRLNLVISSEMKTSGTISLFDNTGALLISKKAIVNKGITNLTVDKLNNLSQGFYFIKVEAGETILIRKLIK